ncbi:MAG: DUF1559 domain-containing protein, partial [Pirellulaceae bacterium]|nr:DUF1559 domain-containing protein [Pirellulaceae bacterium]
MKKDIRAFTLVELLVVIAIIGILVAMLLPAVQAAREAARRSQCQHHLAQLIIAVNNYEMAHTAYPTGTVAATGPVRSVPQGYHHGWTTQLLPYVEQGVVYRNIDHSVSVYDAGNAKVRAHNVAFYRCPSSWLGGRGYSDYAGLQHDVEAPIDAANDGIFFLNSKVRYQDVSDGSSQTFFFGEKLATVGDLGWMSGTRAILRNTGTPLNAALTLSAGRPALVGPTRPPGVEDGVDTPADASGDTSSPAEDTENLTKEANDQPDEAKSNSIKYGQPIGPLSVGGFASDHAAGANFALGDGSVRYISETISTAVYQQLGNRH